MVWAYQGPVAATASWPTLSSAAFSSARSCWIASIRAARVLAAACCFLAGQPAIRWLRRGPGVRSERWWDGDPAVAAVGSPVSQAAAGYPVEQAADIGPVAAQYLGDLT